MFFELLAAGVNAAPQNKFGFKEMMFPGGNPNYIALSTAVILAIMSFGSFFLLFTKWNDQRKIFAQGGAAISNFWRAPSLREGASKLERR